MMTYTQCGDCNATWPDNEPAHHERHCPQASANNMTRTTHNPYPALTALLTQAIQGGQLSQAQANLLNMVEGAIRIMPTVEKDGIKPSDLSMLRSVLGMKR